MNKKNIGIILLAIVLAGILIFKEFVFSTTISKKDASQIAPPKEILNFPELKPENDSEKVKIPEVNEAITFILSSNNSIYYYKGAFNGNIQKTDFNSVGRLIRKSIIEIKPENLSFIIKTDENASFKNTIDLLDEMTIEKVPAGHYAEVDILDKEKENIKNSRR